MSELDALIYSFAFAALMVSCVKRRAFVPATLVCTSFFLNEYFYIERVSWVTLTDWAQSLMIKDLFILVLLGFRRSMPEYFLMLFFAVSFAFNWAMKVQIQNEILTLKHLRPDIMTYITVCQLATLYLTLMKGGSSHGGKRGRLPVRIRYPSVSHIFHYSFSKRK